MKSIITACIVLYFIWKIMEILLYKAKIVLSDRDYAKMKWKTIKSLYPINPDKWDYTITYDDEFPLRILYYKHIPIMLNIFDFIKFRIAYKIHAHAYGCDKSNHEALERILTDVQQDIDEKKEQAQKQIDLALKDMRGAINNETLGG